MKRRILAQNAAIGAAAIGTAALSAPALSQGRIEWRMITIWPRNLPGPGVAAQRCADRIVRHRGLNRKPPIQWSKEKGHHGHRGPLDLWCLVGCQS